MSRIFLISLLIFAFLFSGTNASAKRRAYKIEKPPKALLVILKTRKNQIDYMARKEPEHLGRLKKDIRGAMHATLNDFSDHFNYCPVFFFADTMASEIKAGHFDGVLLDKDMKPVKQNILAEGDTTFFIIEFGHMSQASSDGSEAQMTTSLREVLLAMDHRFDLLKWPRPAFARGYFMTSASRYRRQDYWYRSEYYEIDYTPQAAAYSRTLERYYSRP